MKKMLLKGKSIKVVIVLAIIVLISMLYALSAIKQEKNVANAAILENQCDGDHTGWTPLSETGGIIAAGDYYLDDNITLLNNIVINTGTVNLCLNGKILTGAIGSDDSIFQVYGSGVLNIYDCNSDSDVHPYIIKEVFPDATQDLYYGYPQYSSKMFQRYYDFTGIGDGVIVGGVITGGHKYSTSTDLKNNFYYPGGGSAILIGSESAMDLGGTVNMYGGTISGNTVTALSQFGGKRERAGAVCVKDGGNFNMYGGAIRGNSARMVGAALYLFGGNSDAYRANAKIYGGIITDNYGLDTVYNYSNQSGWDSVGAFATDNVMPGSSVISIEGNPYISGNYGYSFTVAPNTYPEANTYFSSETYNVLRITGKLYIEKGGEKQYARIGLSVDATPSLTSGYTTFGNLPEDVNKVFYADLRTRAVAFNQDTLEVKYAAANLKTLTYVANYDGGSTSEISVVDSISVDSAMFERNGYAFASWNTESSGSGTTYYPNDIITLNSNQTLYAQWNKEQYSINYWLNGGTLSGQNTSYLYGTSYTLPIPTYNSYDFEGWYDNALLEGLAVTSVTTTDFGNKTFYAKWSDAIFYTITSTSGSNGTISPLGSIIYDGTSQDYRIIPDSGYKVAAFTVNGIDKKSQLINNSYTISNVTSDTDIAVTFEKIVLADITFYATSTAGGTISPSGYTVIQLFDNITFTITPQPGYKISDVKVNNVSVGPTVNYSFIHAYKGFAVHAEFVSCMAEIVFNKNGGTFIETYKEPVLYEEGIGLTLPLGGEIIRQGYTFDGWYINEDFDGEPITEVLSTDIGKKEFFAKWTETTTLITLNKNGADADATVTATYGSTLPSFSALTRSGYTLKGYFTTISGNIKVINADGTLVPNISGYTDASGNWQNTSANLALFAQWSLNSIVIASTSGYTGAFDNASHNITITASHELSSNYTLTYQWYKDSVSEDNKVGTNSSYPVKDNVDSGSYICVVSITDGTQTASETSSEVTVSISRVDISDAVITLGDNLIYNGQEQTQTIASVVVDTLNVTYTVSGNKQTNHSASGYTLTVTGSGNFSGTATRAWSIMQKEVGLVWDSLSSNELIYNRQEKIVGATLIGVETDDTCLVTVVLTSGNDNVNAGSFTYTATELSNSNYKLPDTVVSGSYIITAKEITITAQSKTSMHKKPLQPLTYQVSPELFAGDSLSGELTSDADQNTVGTYSIAIGTLDAGSNYSVSFVGADYFVAEKLTVTIDQTAQSIEYDGSAKAFLLSGTSLTGFIVEYYVDNNYTLVSPAKAGSYNIRISRDEDDDYYEFSLVIGDGLVIATQKVNKPSENNSIFVYNGTEQTYVLTSDSRFSITNAARTNAGSQSVTVALIDKDNYEWTSGGVENVIFNFYIAQKDITDAEIALGSSLIYNGQEQTQTIASVVVDTLNVTYTVSGNKQTNHSANGYTLTVTGSGNFSGTATKTWNISKSSYDMSGVTFESKTIKADNNIKSIAISGQLPEGVSVRYEGNGKSVAGVYTVTAIFVYDSVNYNSIANKTATLTLLLPQISETAEGNDTEKPDIIVSSEKGFEPDIELIISVIPNERIELELDKNSVLSKAYGVRLVRGEEDMDLNEELTVRLLIPSNIVSENFKIYSGENTVDYAIADGYAVFDIDSLSNLAFVYDTTEKISLLWLIIVLSLLLLAEIALAAIKILADKKNKKSVKTYAFAPIFLAAVLPAGELTATIVLGVLCGLAALFDIYLFLIRDRLLKKNVSENAEQEVSKAEILKIGTVLENNETALDLIIDEYDDEAEQLKGIEENNGRAILVRYRKAFLAKLIQSPEETKGYYSLLKNAILSYEKTSSHISFNYDSINRGRKKLAKFNIRGKTLYLYLALSPKPFANSKYKVEPSDKKKYIETPCLYKIKNELRAKYALELIAGMAEKFGIKKGTEQNIDYNLPYQTTEELIAKGLIKELVSKKNYEEWKRFQNQSTVNRKKRTFVSASEVNDILLDEVAAALIVEKKKENAAPKKEKAIINIDIISASFGQGETVSIQTLNEKGIINNKVNYIKILARGRLDKPLTIEASDFSMEAVKMILLTGGKVIKIV